MELDKNWSRTNSRGGCTVDARRKWLEAANGFMYKEDSNTWRRVGGTMSMM